MNLLIPSSILIFTLLLFYLLNKKKGDNTCSTNKNAKSKEDIVREIKYLEFSIKSGNNPFNNYALNGEFTLLSMERFKNVKYIVENIIKNNIDGDILEAGTWRGGSMLYTKGILNAYGVINKQIFLLDTFSGFPTNAKVSGSIEKNLIIGPGADELKSNSLEKVKSIFDAYNLSSGVNFIQGAFEDTITKTSIPKLSYLRLDADSYANTKYLLENLYSKLNKNGYIEFDDYGSFPGCKKAVDEFRETNRITNQIYYVDERPGMPFKYEAVYWIK